MGTVIRYKYIYLGLIIASTIYNFENWPKISGHLHNTKTDVQ